MNILLVNTSEMAGGAAIAASRLCDSLNRRGVQATLLVRDRETSRATTRRVPVGGLRGMRLQAAFLWERFRIWWANGFRRQGLFAVDIGVGGASIVDTPEFKAADIIHLHWVNQGFLSLAELRRILRSGKPVVWTMHDMWVATGICHYAGDCDRFHTHCHDCPQLLRPAPHDLSWRIFDRKATIYSEGRISFVGCSRWIADQARQSRLIGAFPITNIPNTYDHHVFCPGSQEEGRLHFTLPRRLRLLLFVCQKVTDPRKGLEYLFTALRSQPLHAWQGRLALVVVGQMADDVAERIPLPIHTLDYISNPEDMALLYRAVDLFVTPSLEDNLPNTIMEAMACGTPCVGFNVGGIPEMIDHGKNGYVARYRDADDLAKGIDHVLSDPNYQELANAAAQKATTVWNEQRVTDQYIELYQQQLRDPVNP
ncbi:MAG: glycosyltransferase [Bacteroidaceae bacterium]|nr:glycosyltransferase [Bacteroidaceae bacterium]